MSPSIKEALLSDAITVESNSSFCTGTQSSFSLQPLRKMLVFYDNFSSWFSASMILALLSLHHKVSSWLQQQQHRVYFDKHPLAKRIPLTGALDKGKRSNVTLKSELWESRETATKFSIYTPWRTLLCYHYFISKPPGCETTAFECKQKHKRVSHEMRPNKSPSLPAAAAPEFPQGCWEGRFPTDDEPKQTGKPEHLNQFILSLKENLFNTYISLSL